MHLPPRWSLESLSMFVTWCDPFFVFWFIRSAVMFLLMFACRHQATMSQCNLWSVFSDDVSDFVVSRLCKAIETHTNWLQYIDFSCWAIDLVATYRRIAYGSVVGSISNFNANGARRFITMWFLKHILTRVCSVFIALSENVIKYPSASRSIVRSKALDAFIALQGNPRMFLDLQTTLSFHS